METKEIRGYVIQRTVAGVETGFYADAPYRREIGVLFCGSLFYAAIFATEAIAESYVTELQTTQVGGKLQVRGVALV